MTDESFRPFSRSFVGPKVCTESTRFILQEKRVDQCRMIPTDSCIKNRLGGHVLIFCSLRDAIPLRNYLAKEVVRGREEAAHRSSVGSFSEVASASGATKSILSLSETNLIDLGSLGESSLMNHFGFRDGQTLHHNPLKGADNGGWEGRAHIYRPYI